MHPLRRKRLAIVLILVLGIGTAVGLTLYALKQNMNLFYSPSQIAAGEAPLERSLRVGGLVLPGSVQRDANSLRVSFTLTDNLKQLRVNYEGILPDLFREGQGMIARGVLKSDGTLWAEEVLAKHDENYMPPEVAGSLKQAGVWRQEKADTRRE
jgi:cytochrome c-type biogenesis protein CcmE